MAIPRVHIVPRSVQRVTSESRARIVAATHDATAFRLDCDSIRIENRAFALAIEMCRQTFFLWLSLDTDVFEGVGLALHFPACARDRERCSQPFSIDSTRTAHHGN
jgi:hypothetical protein